MSAFVRFFAGERVALYIYSEDDINLKVRSTTSFTFHYIGMLINTSLKIVTPKTFLLNLSSSIRRGAKL